MSNYKRPNSEDVIVGGKVGRLLLLKEVRIQGKNRTVPGYLCQCDCGNTKIVHRSNLLSGAVTSCGCFHKEVVSKKNGRHRKSGERVYRTWADMKSRCFDKGHISYDRYGSRGITVCDRWKNSFEAFYADMGDPPGNEYSIDRINPNGNYEPGNCRWATQKQQAQNTRRNYLVFYNGKERSIAEVADIVGISRGTLYQRIKGYGWSVERATTTPVQTKFRRKNYAKH